MYGRQTTLSLDELIARHKGEVEASEPPCLWVNEIGLIALDLTDDERVAAQRYLAQVLDGGTIEDRYPAFGYAHMLVLQDRAEPDLVAQVEVFEEDPSTKAVADLVKVRSREMAAYLSPRVLS